MRSLLLEPIWTFGFIRTALVQARFPSTLVPARRCIAWGATEVALPAMVA